MVVELGPQRLGEFKNQAENFDGSLPPDALTRGQEIVDKLKQHQIVLPNGKLVLARGKISNRNLTSLVAAFNEDRPIVDSKELIAPDTSAGIPIKEAQTNLYNSIYRLRRTTLKGTGCNILTIREKRGNVNATGAYCLAITTSRTTENPSMETLILSDGTTIISLYPRPKKMLQGIIDSGDKGMTTEELQQPHIDKGVDRKTASNRVHDDLRLIKAALNGTRFTNVNLTSRADSRRGKSARYVFMERPQEELAIIDQQRQNGYSLPEGGETTIFATKGNDDSVTQSPSEDLQDEENGDEDSPQEIEEARQNSLKQQARLQLALNILNAVRSGKLQTLDRNVDEYVQSSLPAGISVRDTKKFMLESLDAGLNYWNRNEWDLGPNPSAQERGLIKTCIELRMGSLHSEETKKRVIQEIRTNFSLP